jgi:hypothetical protein
MFYHFVNTDVYVSLSKITAIEFQHYADGQTYAVKVYFEDSSYNIVDKHDVMRFREYLERCVNES